MYGYVAQYLYEHTTSGVESKEWLLGVNREATHLPSGSLDKDAENLTKMDVFCSCQVLGPEEANKQLQRQWETWVTEEDHKQSCC